MGGFIMEILIISNYARGLTRQFIIHRTPALGLVT
jgi:hypothetical protein